MKDGTAETYLNGILKAIDNAHLNLKNLLSVGMDGPNVNKSLLRKLNEELKNLRRDPVLDIGSCQLHVLHNSYRKGTQLFGFEAEKLIILIHKWFKHASR